MTIHMLVRRDLEFRFTLWWYHW